MIDELIKELQKKSNKEKAKVLQKFFKTGKGEYGEGDVFLGVTVPEQRKIAKKHVQTELDELQQPLASRIHEERLTALLILVEKYNKGNKKEIFDFYIKNIRNINNWDLVDLTAEKIIGDYLIDKDKGMLYEMAKSKSIWERRIAIVATYRFIKDNKLEDTFAISKMLLKDKHDLIHKAVGWMLREAGKKNLKGLESFLDIHYKEMPRTMLRYAIERMDNEKKNFYIKK